MSESETTRKLVAPYPAWPTFKSFLGDLVAKGTPSRIDHTVMVGKSGSAQSAIRKALQFLGLTNTKNAPTSRLHGLLGAFDSDEWPSTLGTVILEAYAPIVGELDIENGTAQQLADCFRKHGNVSGNTLTMAVRFFLGALDEAGVKRSTYFVAPRRPPTKKKSVRTPPKDTAAAAGGQEGGLAKKAKDAVPPRDPSRPSTRWPSQPFLLPTRDEPIVIQAPTDLNLAEWTIIDAFVRGRIELAGSEKPPSAVRTADGG